MKHNEKEKFYVEALKKKLKLYRRRERNGEKTFLSKEDVRDFENIIKRASQ